MKFNFIKMQGCGNDFLLLDAMRESEPPTVRGTLVEHVCDRHFGIGADGLVVLSRSRNFHAFWQFFNCDGSEAAMCGNAARCAVRYVSDKYFPQEELIQFESRHGNVKGRMMDASGRVEVALRGEGRGRGGYVEKIIRNDEVPLRVYCIDTGVPHAVIQVEDIRTYPITKVGQFLVGHSAFGNAGTNVTFFQPNVGSQILSTTFERGVEKETLACGTGAAAAALVYGELYMTGFPIQVEVPGGHLEVDLSPVAKLALLRGPAEYVYELGMEEITAEYERRRPFEGTGTVNKEEE